MRLSILLAGLGLVLLGMLLGAGLFANAAPDDTILEQVVAINPLQPGPTPMASPKDRVPENAIIVYGDRVLLDLQNAQWSTFTDTHSMEPVIMHGSNAIQIVPRSADELQVGDIVSYESEYAKGTIIHRIVYKGEDESGVYFVMKGDNLPTSDPGRIRFEQIRRVVVAIVY